MQWEGWGLDSVSGEPLSQEGYEQSVEVIEARPLLCRFSLPAHPCLSLLRSSVLVPGLAGLITLSLESVWVRLCLLFVLLGWRRAGLFYDIDSHWNMLRTSFMYWYEV